jgi:hypothetical protein
MKLQILSDLHLETECFRPQPAPGADLLVLAGDIDTRWAALQRFEDWPVPVLMVAGNHEFEGRELTRAWQDLRAACASAGIRLLERESIVLDDADGRRVRFVGTTRWSDFGLFGERSRAKAERAASYFLRQAGTLLGGKLLDAPAMRTQAQACRAWLEDELMRPGDGRWDVTVVITHYAPSVRSADPRYGRQPGTASFCNADDDLIPRADLWIHGHLHCRQDYWVARPGRQPARVVCQARGHADKGECEHYEAGKLFEV